MRKHNYVVGYKGENQCVYGKDKYDDRHEYIDLLTLEEARALTKKIVCGQKSVVYKLVEVK